MTIQRRDMNRVLYIALLAALAVTFAVTTADAKVTTQDVWRISVEDGYGITSTRVRWLEGTYAIRYTASTDEDGIQNPFGISLCNYERGFIRAWKVGDYSATYKVTLKPGWYSLVVRALGVSYAVQMKRVP